MSRSEITLSCLGEIQKETKNTEFISECWKNYLIGICNQFYPLLDFETFQKACSQVISVILIGCWKGLKPIDHSVSCKLQPTSAAIYGEVLWIEYLEQSTVSFLT